MEAGRTTHFLFKGSAEKVEFQASVRQTLVVLPRLLKPMAPDPHDRWSNEGVQPF
jgi:hypothetical protein